MDVSFFFTIFSASDIHVLWQMSFVSDLKCGNTITGRAAMVETNVVAHVILMWKVFYTALDQTVSLTRMDDAQIKLMQFRGFVILLNTNIKLSFKSKFITTVCNKLGLWRALVSFPTSSFFFSHVTQSFTITASLVERCQMLNFYFLQQLSHNNNVIFN